MDDFSIIELFLQASLVVQAVMVILLMVSIISWIIIFVNDSIFQEGSQSQGGFSKDQQVIPARDLFFRVYHNFEFHHFVKLAA